MIAVLPCSGERSVYLPCLAAVGSLVGRLEVLDHTYRKDLQSLLGEAQPPAQSQSIAVRTGSGQCVRLIEVAQPERLSRGEWSRLARAVDGVIYLATQESTEGALRSRLERSVEHAPTEVLLHVDAGSLESDPAGRTGGNALALEAIRRSFTHRSETSLDWPAVFDVLWKPVSSVLNPVSVYEGAPGAAPRQPAASEAVSPAP
jgi:hypothetical protein